MLNVGISTIKEKERMLCVNRLMVNWSSFRGVRKGYIIAHSPQQVYGALTCFEQVFVQCIIFLAEKRGENRTRDQVRLCRIFQKKKKTMLTFPWNSANVFCNSSSNLWKNKSNVTINRKNKVLLIYPWDSTSRWIKTHSKTSRLLQCVYINTGLFF